MSDPFDPFDLAPSGDDAHKPGIWVPAFLETEPGGGFKPLHDCSRSEIEAKIISLTMQAQALMEQANGLNFYLENERPQ